MYPGVHAKTHPDKPAVIMAGSGRTTTYAELDDRSLRLAHLLADAGLGPGDHVALLADNQPEAFEVYWAALRSGLIITAINWHLSPGEAAYILDDCEASALVVVGGRRRPGRRGGRGAGRLRAKARLRRSPWPVTTATRRPWPRPPPPRWPSQPRGADMLYSSGTTGRPKGIMGTLPGDRRSTSRVTCSSASSPESSAWTPTPSTSRRRRSTTPPRCDSAAGCTPAAAPSS